MRISIFGTGYVGLVTGSCLAKLNHEVFCVDKDDSKISALNHGEIPIFEPGLEEIVKSQSLEGRLRFTTNAELAIGAANIVFIAVGTPSREDGSADLTAIRQVAGQIGNLINQDTTVVCKSTVPVGTADEIQKIIDRIVAARNLDLKVDVVSNPEFLKEGQAVQDFMMPERIIIGSSNVDAGNIVADLYSALNVPGENIIQMDNRSAELTKYAANAMLATRISFINQIAEIAQLSGANIQHIIKGIGSDSRIGNKFLQPGLGYGGSCFPKDVRALRHFSTSLGIKNSDILDAVESVNQRQQTILVEMATNHFGDLGGLTFGIWGLAFKPGTDDVREAPSLKVISALLESGARVQLHDPVAETEFKKQLHLPSNCFKKSPKEALHGADALMVLTEWEEYLNYNFSEVISELGQPVIFDGRNIFEPNKEELINSAYYSVGR